MRIERVLAPNPGPFTGAGTNTWIVDGGTAVTIIDPGPLMGSHAEAVMSAVGERTVAAIVVTHTHEDHAPLANPLAAELDAPAYGYAPGPGFDPDLRLTDGATVRGGDVDMVVVHTPGHSDDHICLLADRVLFTGDHIIGGSSVMVENMSSYLASLDRIRILDVDVLHPGHGDVMDEPAAVVDWYVAHRMQREREIVDAIARGASTVPDIVEVVYAAVDSRLHPLAARSVVAHLAKLEADGVVRSEGAAIHLTSIGRSP